MGPNDGVDRILIELAKNKSAKRQMKKGVPKAKAEKFAKHSTRGAMKRRLMKNKTGIGGF